MAFEARLTGPQGSGILTSMMRADALLIVPEGQFETAERRDGPGAGAGQSDAPGTPALLSLFAVSAPGLEELTARELTRWAAPASRRSRVASPSSGDWETMARANLWLRTASRVLVRFGTFHARALGELERRASLLPWDKYLTPGRPVHLRVTSRKSRLYHQGAIAERIGNGIREVTGTSPESASGNEEASGDEQVVVVRVLRDECLVSLDSSGELLHRRGYRLATAKAPLRETLAAALLMASEWDGVHPLIDPFSGSGTIPIEAALLARKIPPGLNRQFGFQRWRGYEPAQVGGPGRVCSSGGSCRRPRRQFWDPTVMRVR